MPDLAELNLIIKSEQVQQAKGRLDQMHQAGMRAEQMAKKLAGGVQDVNRGYEQQVGILGRVQNAYAGMQGLLWKIAAGAGAVGVVLKAINEAGKMEQLQVGFTTLLKDADQAKTMLADLRKFANETPFEFPDLALAAKKMLALGFAAKDILPMLTDVGDTASALGIGAEGMDRIIGAMGKIKNTGRVTAEEMNMLTDAGVSGWKYVAAEMGVTEVAARKMSEQGLIPAERALKAIREGMKKDFAGGMEQQSKTLLGLWSSFRDAVTTGLADVGEAIMEAFDLKGKLKDFTAWFDNFRKVLVDVIRGLAGMSPKYAELASTTNAWVRAIKDVATILGVVFGAYTLVKIEQMIVGTAKLIKNFYDMKITAHPLLTIVLAIGAAIAGWSFGSSLFENFEWLQNALESVRYFVVDISLSFSKFMAKLGASSWVNVALAPTGFSLPKEVTTALGDEKAIAKAQDFEKQVHDARMAEIKRDFAAKGNRTTGQVWKDILSDTLSEAREALTALRDQVSALVSDPDAARAAKEASATLEGGPGGKPTTRPTAPANIRTSLEVYLEELRKERDLISMTNAEAAIRAKQMEMEKVLDTELAELAGKLNWNDEQKATRKKELLGLLGQEMRLNMQLKAQREGELEMNAMQRDLDMLKLTKSERDVQLALAQVTAAATKEQIALDSEWLVNAEAKVRSMVAQRDMLEKIDKAATQMGDAFSSAFEDAVFGAKSLGEALQNLALDIEKIIFRELVGNPMGQMVAGLAKSAMGGFNLFGGGGGATAVGAGSSAAAGAAAGAIPHAMGDVFSSPLLFASGGRLHQLGEAGPEAVMPLQRDQTGRLGVRGGRPTVVSINVVTPDADSFRRSASQVARAARKAFS